MCGRSYLTTPFHSAQHHTTQNHVTLYHTVPHHTMLYHTTSHHTAPHHIHYTILIHGTPHIQNPPKPSSHQNTVKHTAYTCKLKRSINFAAAWWHWCVSLPHGIASFVCRCSNTLNILHICVWGGGQKSISPRSPSCSEMNICFRICVST
jgi:hypothetical protein